MERAEMEQAIRLHESLEFMGLRAQATSVGLLQLCAELVAVGVLDDAAVERIKTAIRKDITVSNPRRHGRDAFDATLRKRLDSIFPTSQSPRIGAHVGTAQEMREAMEGDRG